VKKLSQKEKKDELRNQEISISEMGNETSPLTHTKLVTKSKGFYWHRAELRGEDNPASSGNSTKKGKKGPD